MKKNLTEPSNHTFYANQGTLRDQSRLTIQNQCTLNTTNNYRKERKTISSLELINELKTHYQKNDKLTDMLEDSGPILTLSEGCYVNLALVRSEEQNKAEFETLKISDMTKTHSLNDDKADINNKTLRDHRLSSFEDIYRKKEPLPLAKLFKQHSSDKQKEEKPIQRVLMLGRAGIGKSTLCQYLAYLWAHLKRNTSITSTQSDATQQTHNSDLNEIVTEGNNTPQLNKEEQACRNWLNEYDAVFHVELRQLASLYKAFERKGKTLGVPDVIAHACLPSFGQFEEEKYITAISTLLQDSHNNILWLLDGFDEVAHLYSDTRKNEAPQLHKLLHELFPQATSPNYKPYHHILLTSRPYAASGFKVDREVENIGLVNDDIPRYITQYFAKLKNSFIDMTAVGDGLIKQIESNPNLHGLAHVPINTYLLCFLYQREAELHPNTQPEQLLSTFSLTQLYQRLVTQLCARHQLKEGNTHLAGNTMTTYKTALQTLASLAFEGLTTTQSLIMDWTLQESVFTHHNLTPDIYQQSILPLGFLKSIRDLCQNNLNAPRYFIHLTFQEFFAACHLVWGLSKDGDKANIKQQVQAFTRCHKYTPRYQVIFWFAAGLVSDKSIFGSDIEQTEQQQAFQLFWHEGLLAKPLDLTGFGHFELLTRTFEEGGFFDTKNNTCIDKQLQTKAQTHEEQCTELLLRHSESNLAKRLIPAIQACPKLKAIVAYKLLKTLKSADKCVRRSAAEALRTIKPQDTQNINAFVVASKDKAWYKRRNMTQALGTKPQDLSSINALVELLQHENADVRSSAADALGTIKSQDPNSINALLEALKDKDWKVRSSAADALGAIKPQDPNSINALLEALKDKDWYIRSRAADALGAIKPKNANTINALLEALKDKEWKVCRSAEQALRELKDCVQLNMLLPLLHSNLYGHERTWLTLTEYDRWLHDYFYPNTQHELQISSKLRLLSQLLARFAMDYLQLAITIQENIVLVHSSQVNLSIKVLNNAHCQKALAAFKESLKSERLFTTPYRLALQNPSAPEKSTTNLAWQLRLVREAWSQLQQYSNNSQTELVYYLGYRFIPMLEDVLIPSTVNLLFQMMLISLQAGSQLNEKIPEKFIKYLTQLCKRYLSSGHFERLPKLSESLLKPYGTIEEESDNKTIELFRLLAHAYQASGQLTFAQRCFDKAVSQTNASKLGLLLDCVHHCITCKRPEKALSLLVTVLPELSTDELKHQQEGTSTDELSHASSDETDEESSSSERTSKNKPMQLVYVYQEFTHSDKGLQSYSNVKISTLAPNPRQEKDTFEQDNFEKQILKLNASQVTTLAYYFKVKAHHMLNQTQACNKALQTFKSLCVVTAEEKKLHTHLSQALTEFMSKPSTHTVTNHNKTICTTTKLSACVGVGTMLCTAAYIIFNSSYDCVEGGGLLFGSPVLALYLILTAIALTALIRYGVVQQYLYPVDSSADVTCMSTLLNLTAQPQEINTDKKASEAQYDVDSSMQIQHTTPIIVHNPNTEDLAPTLTSTNTSPDYQVLPDRQAHVNISSQP